MFWAGFTFALGVLTAIWVVLNFRTVLAWGWVAVLLGIILIGGYFLIVYLQNPQVGGIGQSIAQFIGIVIIALIGSRILGKSSDSSTVEGDIARYRAQRKKPLVSFSGLIIHHKYLLTFIFLIPLIFMTLPAYYGKLGNDLTSIIFISILFSIMLTFTTLFILFLFA